MDDDTGNTGKTQERYENLEALLTFHEEHVKKMAPPSSSLGTEGRDATAGSPRRSLEKVLRRTVSSFQRKERSVDGRFARSERS